MDVGRPTTSSSSSTPTTAPNEAATRGGATDLEVQSRPTKLPRRCGGPSWRPARRSAGASRCRPSGWARWCRRLDSCGAKRAGEVVHLRVCLRGLPIVLEREPVRRPSGKRPLKARVRILWGSARPGRRSPYGRSFELNSLLRLGSHLWSRRGAPGEPGVSMPCPALCAIRDPDLAAVVTNMATHDQPTTSAVVENGLMLIERRVDFA